jgi:hypothetical protein
MLKISYKNKEDYNKIKSRIKDDKNYTYWDVCSYKVHDVPEPSSSDWQYIDRLVYDNEDNCIGIIEAPINREQNIVTNISVYNLGNKFIFGKALKEFFDILFLDYKFRTLTWYCRADNPSNKLYSRYGRLVGTLNQFYLIYGNKIVDANIYEITRDDYIKLTK